MRHVIKKDLVRLVEGGPRAPKRAGAGAPANLGPALPAVRVVETGPGTRAIEVTCRCGEVVLLEVDVAPAQPNRSSP